MNGSFWKAEQVGNRHSTSIFFSRGRLLSGAQDAPSRFQSPAKRTMGWLATCSCFQSKRWVNYHGPSWGSQAAQHEAGGTSRTLNELPEIWLPNCSSSPWLSTINLIRYSFNENILHSPWKDAAALRTWHTVKWTAFSRKCQGWF